MAKVFSCTPFPEMAVLNVDSDSCWEIENYASKQDWKHKCTLGFLIKVSGFFFSSY